MKRAARNLIVAAIVALLGAAQGVRAEDRVGVDGPSHPTRERRHQVNREELRHDAPLSLRSWIASLPEERRRGAIRRLRNMPLPRRAEFFERWKKMDEGERRQFTRHLEGRARQHEIRRETRQRRALHERMAEMTPPRRQQFRRQLKQWNGLEPAEKDKLRRRLRHFRTLSPAEQEELVDEHFSSHSSEQRRGILDGLRAASSALH